MEINITNTTLPKNVMITLENHVWLQEKREHTGEAPSV
jgi:hypothetical protein